LYLNYNLRETKGSLKLNVTWNLFFVRSGVEYLYLSSYFLCFAGQLGTGGEYAAETGEEDLSQLPDAHSWSLT
jgi:hypothetical protein